MLKKLLSRFTPTKVVYIPKNVDVKIDSANKAAITALADHPGMKCILAELRLHQAQLETILRTQRHADIRSIDNLQMGIKWASWLERRIEVAIGMKQKQEERDAYKHEEKILQDALASIQDI